MNRYSLAIASIGAVCLIGLGCHQPDARPAVSDQGSTGTAGQSGGSNVKSGASETMTQSDTERTKLLLEENSASSERQQPVAPAYDRRREVRTVTPPRTAPAGPRR